VADPVALVVGTFDREYARNRQILRLLERLGYDVRVEHVPLWGETRFDALSGGLGGASRLAVKVVAAEARVAWRLLRAPRPDLVVVLYPGQLDMFAVGVLARLRRLPVMLEFFISLRETMVDDRRLARPGGWLDRVLAVVDRASLRLASCAVADTPADRRYFAEIGGIDESRIGVVWVGAEATRFPERPLSSVEPGTVLFYGTYIPLQGIDTIVRASVRPECRGLRFRLLGQGQDRSRIERLVAELDAPVEFLDSVSEWELVDHIERAEICLGVFDTGAKAARVIPNKVFQCLSVGRPVVTAATPAVLDALDGAVATVAPGDADALARELGALHNDPLRRGELVARGRELMEGVYGDGALTVALGELLSLSSSGR
jgi:glycosyltransferase involved in cell wall biosynthesis